MTDTAIVAASFAGQTSGALLSAYVPQSGDLNATFARLGHGGSGNLAFGASGQVDNLTTSADVYYSAGAALTGAQSQLDLTMDIDVASATSTFKASCVGVTIGDDGTGANYLEVLSWQGTSCTTPGFHVTNHVGSASADLIDPSYTVNGPAAFTASISGNVLTVPVGGVTSGKLGIGCLISASGLPAGLMITGLGTGTGADGTYTLSASVGTVASEAMSAIWIYTVQVQIRGSAGAYTINLLCGPKGGAATTLASGVAVPSLVLTGRSIGLRQTFIPSTGTAAQPDATGLHARNFYAYSYTPSYQAGSVTATTGSSPYSAVANGTAASYGSSPYSYQFQRAPDAGGAPGTWSNVGSPGASLTYNDSSLAAGTYWYRYVVTDSGSNVATSNAAPVSIVPPGFGVTTTPASLQLTQGTSVSLSANLTAVGGYTGSDAVSVTGLPAGVTGSLSPSTIANGSGSTTLTLTASGAAATGPATATVSATDGTLTASCPLAINVVPAISGITIDTVNNGLQALQSVVAGLPRTF